MSAFIVWLLVVMFLGGLVIGAYSHKWLERETGAPKNINADNAVSALQSAAKTAAKNAATAIHDAVYAEIDAKL